jgi:hypothetical protein
MSWVSEIAHDQTKVTLFAAIVGGLVGFSGSTVALIIGWRQGTSSRLAAEAAKASAEAATITARAAGDRAVGTMRLQWGPGSSKNPFRVSLGFGQLQG